MLVQGSAYGCCMDTHSRGFVRYQTLHEPHYGVYYWME